jgi:hypothetical protein
MRLEDAVANFDLQHKREINYFWIVLVDYIRCLKHNLGFSDKGGHDRISEFMLSHNYDGFVTLSFEYKQTPEYVARILDILEQERWGGVLNQYGDRVLTSRNIFYVGYVFLEHGFYIFPGFAWKNYIRSRLIGAGGTTKRERDEGEEKEYENCENEEDPLTHQLITELDPEAVVHIGPHCFDVEMIWFWVKRYPTDPITNERFTDEQVERIYEQYLRWSEVKLERQGHPLPRPIHRLLEIYYRAVEERVGERPRLLLTFVVGGQYYRLYTSPLDQVQYLRQLVYNYILTRDPKIMIEWRRYYNAKPNPNIIRIFHGDRELLNDRRIEEYGLGNNTLLTLGQTIMDPKPWVY